MLTFVDASRPSPGGHARGFGLTAVKWTIAGLLIPLHHRMEKLITNMLVSKNNRVRLEAARRTIEELEGAGKSETAS